MAITMKDLVYVNTNLRRRRRGQGATAGDPSTLRSYSGKFENIRPNLKKKTFILIF